jgi:hypothetical protein
MAKRGKFGLFAHVYCAVVSAERIFGAEITRELAKISGPLRLFWFGAVCSCPLVVLRVSRHRSPQIDAFRVIFEMVWRDAVDLPD